MSSINEAINALQRIKRAQAKDILANSQGVNDMKEAMRIAGGISVYRRTGHNTVEEIYFQFSPTRVAGAGGYGSYRGVVIHLDNEY